MSHSDNKVQVCWFDRQNVITTRVFDIFEDFSSFIGFIAAFSRFSLDDWGIEKRFYPATGNEIMAELRPEPGESGGGTLAINLQDIPLCHRVALHGRGTMVLRGTMVGEKKPVAVKTSYPQVGRRSERYFVRKGGQSEGTEHLPLIYHSEDVGCPTSKIRERLGLNPRGTPRCRRIIVSEVLHPLHSLPVTEAGTAWLQCLLGRFYVVKCSLRMLIASPVHREMWQKGCQHGDISVHNLMYRGKLEEPNAIVGVLNDWDLSILSDDTESQVTGSALQFTGTIPFAALDLIEDNGQPRKYRHDLESFGWSLAYICLDHPDSRHLLTPWHGFPTTVAHRLLFLSRMHTHTPKNGFEGLYAFAQDFLLWIISNTGRRIPIPKHEPIKNHVQLGFKDLKSQPFQPKKPLKPTPAWVEPSEETLWKEFQALHVKWSCKYTCSS